MRVRVALVALTFGTGIVDAVSYLGLGHVFTANMTGNIVLLGFGLAGTGGLPVVAPLVSLAAFLVGSGLGGRLARRVAEERRLAAALWIEVVAVGLAAVLAAIVTVRIGEACAYAVIALLAFGMGVRNATVRVLAVPDLTTTVLTMTLTGLAADSPAAGGTGAGSTRRIVAVLAMLAGAFAGALLTKSSLALPLVCAAVLALVVRLAYPSRRDGARQTSG